VGGTKSDTVRLLNALARSEIYLARTDDAAEHAQQALNLATQHGDSEGRAEADLNIALNTVNQGRIDRLEAVTTDALTMLEGIDRPDLISEAMLRAAMMYRRLGQPEASVTMTLQSMDVAKRSNSPLALTYAYQGLGMSLGQSGRDEEAQAQFQLMREQARAAGATLLEGAAIEGIAVATANRGDLRGAEALFREGVLLATSVRAPFSVNHALFALAANLGKQNRWREALQILDDIEHRYQQYPNKLGLWYTLEERSQVRQSMGQLGAATTDAEKALELANNVGNLAYQSDSHRRLAAIASARRDYGRAYDLQQQADVLNARASRDHASLLMTELAQRYRVETRQRELEALQRRNEQQSAELRQRQLEQRWLWTILAGSIAALAGTAVLLLMRRAAGAQLAAANQQLQRSRDDVQALNAGLEQRVAARTAELRQQTRYLRTLIDVLPMWAWLKDSHLQYLVTNEAYARARGYAPADMIGKDDAALLSPEVAGSLIADDREVMASRQQKTSEELVDTGTGKVWMNTYKTAIIDDDGTVLGTVGIARDVSVQRAAEAARDSALREAERLARARSEFLTRVSHELRTPLNAILGFAQILQDEEQMTERQRRGVVTIQRSGQHLLMLINDLLDLARIDAGKLDLNPSDVDLVDFLAVVTDIMRIKAEKKGLAFISEFSPMLPRSVKVDEKRLREVLLNLLSNAIKFTDAGEVKFRVSSQTVVRGQSVQVDANKPAFRLRFEIEDSGIGMSDEDVAQLFQPFARVGEGPRRSAGAGLGLAISRHLVRLMGGDIAVHSAPRIGTQFSFEIVATLGQPRAIGVGGQRRRTGYLGERRTALVVDDDPDSRAALCELLRNLGFQVLEGKDGRECLEHVALRAPDLIIMDVMMPGMDGLEATRRIRADPEHASAPIIAVSASVSPDDQARSIAAGANCVAPKPVDHEFLLSAIGSLLGLEWLYGEHQELGVVSEATKQEDYVVPSADELEALHRIARTGSMREVIQEARRIESLDARNAPFARHIASLALAYESKAILALLDRYRSAAGADAGLAAGASKP
jgi:PAS domain S-box-containing protein